MREQTQTALRDPALRGVVFVVDVAALIRNASLVTEYVPPSPRSSLPSIHHLTCPRRELIPILTTLCARALTHPSAPPVRLLILGNKSDLVAKQPTPSTEASIENARRAGTYDRLITLLIRDLSRVKSSRAASSGRIDSIDRIPTAATTTSRTNPLSIMRRFLGSASLNTRPDDDAYVTERAEDALWGSPSGSGDARFRFEEIEGVEVTVAVGSAVRGREGLAEVWEWLEGL